MTWHVPEQDPSVAAALAAELQMSPALARVLVARGLTDPAAARRFLQPGLADLHPSELLPDFETAIERLRRAIEQRETILVWGHEDLDGITAAACLCATFANLRGRALHYIPAKGSERHGLNPERLREFQARGVRLVVTVDCGVSNVAETDAVQAAGVDVIITDHHEPLDVLPRARAVVDPKRADSRYPFRLLAGVGVALKLALGLARRMVGLTVDEFFSTQPELLTLAALGTIADRVPLQDENRVMAGHGLRQMGQSRLAAVGAVLRTAGIPQSDLTVSRFVQELLPLFASADGNLGVEMLLTGDRSRAESWAGSLAEQYREWREEARRTLTRAEQVLEISPGIILVRDEGLSLRSLGHCAARFKEQYLLPACVLGRRDDAWVGECRGVDGVDLVALLKANARYFLDYGGHQKACGFTVPDSMVDDFMAAAREYAGRNFAGRITETREAAPEATVGLSEISEDFRLLAPLGEGNAEPLLLAPGTQLARKGSRVVCPQAPSLVLSEDTASLDTPGVFDVCYALDDNLRVLLRALRPAKSPG